MPLPQSPAPDGGALRQHWKPLGAIVLVVLLAYLNSFTTGWNGDGREMVREDARLARGHGAAFTEVLASAEAGAPQRWARAVPQVSYWLDYSSAAARTGTRFHFTNFLLHLAVCLLVYLLMLQVMRNPWPAFFTALVFGVHPVGTAAVTDIAGRPELFGALWVLGGLVAFLRARTRTGVRQLGWILVVALCQALALLSHETGWMLLPLLGLLFLFLPPVVGTSSEETAAPSRSWGAFSMSLLGAGAVAAGALLLFGWRLFQSPPLTEDAVGLNPLLAADPLSARLTAFGVIGRYLWLAGWPRSLSVDYSFNEIPLRTFPSALWATDTWLTAAAILGLVLLALVLARRARPVLFCTLFFFLTLLPTANLLWLDRAIMRESALYLPLVAFGGWLVSLVYLAARVLVPRLWSPDFRRQNWPTTAARLLLALLVFALAMRTLARNLDWQAEYTLWREAAEHSPRSYRAHLRMASNLIGNEKAQEFGRAIHHIERALAIVQQPAWPLPQPPRRVLLLAGIIYRLEGDWIAENGRERGGEQLPPREEWYEKAVAALQRAAALEAATPGDAGTAADLYWNLGVAHLRLEQPGEALEAFQTLARRAPGTAEAYVRIAGIQRGLRQYHDAAVAYLQAVLTDEKVSAVEEPMMNTFREIDTEGCAINRIQSGDLELNGKCPLVRERLGQAYLGLVQNHLRAGNRVEAERIRDAAISVHQYPAEFFDAAMTEVDDPPRTQPTPFAEQ